VTYSVGKGSIYHDFRKSPKNPKTPQAKAMRSASPVVALEKGSVKGSEKVPEKGSEKVTEEKEEREKTDKLEKGREKSQKTEKLDKEMEEREKKQKLEKLEKLERKLEKKLEKPEKKLEKKLGKEHDKEKDRDKEKEREKVRDRKERRRDDERDKRRDRPKSIDRTRTYDRRRSKKRKRESGNNYDRERGGHPLRWRSTRRERRRRSPSLPPPNVAATEEPNAWKKTKRKYDWREEQRKNDESDVDVPNVDSSPKEDEEKLLEAARQRREAIKAKYATNGQSPPEKTELEAENEVEVEKSKEASDSDSESRETSIGSEIEKRLDTDAEGVKNLNRFIREQKEHHDAHKEPSEEGENMFGQFDTKKRTRAEGVNMTGASAHDWDDQDGYYKPQLEEMMDERYRVFDDSCGKGVFSNVAKARDKKHNVDVAIKVIRNNDMMRRAAEKEIAILRMLNHHDRADKRFVIRLLRTFEYRDHLCMVFECMWDDARTAIKKLGRPGRGLSFNLVHAWTKQLFVALRLLQKCNIIHADLKPDNLLIGGSGKTPVLKVCDLGSAFDASENDITPYIASRFYRAPEIILGHKYDTSLDTWSAAATIFELYSAKILFKGSTNNDMLRKISEIRGKMSHKLIRGGQFGKNHYNEQHDFVHEDIDPATKKPVSRVISDFPNAKPSLLTDMLLEYIPKNRLRSDDPYDDAYVKLVKHCGDFLNRALTLDYKNRLTPEEALQHAFVKSSFPDAVKLTKG